MIQNPFRAGLKAVCLFLMAAGLALSCTRPESYEAFVRSGDAKDGVYRFSLDMSDSTCVYDVSFYTHVDGPLFRRKPLDPFSMHVVWTSCQGNTFSETVWYPASEDVVLYRRGVELEDHGQVDLAVRIDDAPKGLRGLGVICRRVSWDMTN